MKTNFLRKQINILAAALLACFLFTACSSKKDSGKRPDELGLNGGLSEADLNAQREGRYAGAGIPTAEGEGPFRDIHFGFDSSMIDDVARQNLEHNIQVLQGNPKWNVQLEGHTDERGTAEYNMALGSRRAQAVKEVLLSYGVPASRLETISYGEEVPLDPASNEAAWARNRRVHFSAFTNNR